MSENINNIEIIKITKEKVIKEFFLCNQCNKKIYRKIQELSICRDCYNKLTEEYYNKKMEYKKEKENEIKLSKIKPIKLPKIRKLIEHEHINSNGEKLKLFLKSEYKECKNCLENKHYTDYYILRDTHNKSSPNNYYIGTYCRKCANKKQTKKSPYVKEYVNKIIDNQNNNNKVETL